MGESDRPILQLALDFLELDRALVCAHEAVEGGADWLEAGTPLIKSEGLDCVRALRSEFPKAHIVADMKTMDAGRTEMEAAAKSGADLAMVLAVAPESTISECIEAGKNYGIEIGVDLLGVSDTVETAKHVVELGASLVCIHCAIDEQMMGGGAGRFETVRSVAEAVGDRALVAAAGGITSECAADAVKAGAHVVIVGGAIIKSADAKQATSAIRRVLDTGVPEASELYRRGGAAEIREVLSKVSTPNLSDGFHRGGVIPGIHSILPGAHMVGTAVTARTYPGDWAKPVEAIDVARKGDVIVIDAGGSPPAVWGELATESAARKGIAGVVIYGAIRDTPVIRSMGFPAFTKHVCPNAGEPKGFGEIGVPVTIAGVRVSPGDWLLGDDDGVVVIPKERAVEYANRGMDVLEKENRIREEIRRGSTLAEVAELLRWEKKR